MAGQSNDGHQVYYVPESSKLAVCASIGLVLTGIGAASVLNELTFGDGEAGTAWFIFWAGVAFFAGTLFVWFRTTILEHRAGMNSPQLKRSYVIGMQWFIFSEVMFFLAFFGALFYIRMFAGPWLAGEGHFASNTLLWEGFEYNWPMMQTPQEAVGGARAQIPADTGTFMGPEKSLHFPGFANMFAWLPLWNTLVLLTSSVTVHIAHNGLLENNRRKFNQWLGITIVLAVLFTCLQVYEYYEAYVHYGLYLNSGIYGNTFFMLTGFHGVHVLMGAGMLLVQWLRSVYGNHFNSEDHFGFAASSWYWHFVDVVWVLLFLFVYIL